MYLDLIPDLSVLLKEKIVSETHINIMENEVAVLGNILKFFLRGRRISSLGHQSHFYFKEFV